MRLLISGGRTLSPAKVAAWLSDNVVPTIKGVPTVGIYGDAMGADTGARMYFASIPVERLRFKADWLQLGKSAGHIRNTEMLEVGKPNFGIIFPGGRGTTDMLNKLRAANIAVYQAVGDFG